MAFYGRHKVYLLFWPWGTDPFVVTDDIVTIRTTQAVSSGAHARIALYPRHIPTGVDAFGAVVRDDNMGYLDALHPNDWVFAFCDPQSGDDVEPMFVGLIDSVRAKLDVGADGSRTTYVDVSVSGWEKAVMNTVIMTHPYVSENINLPALVSLGPAGQQPTRSATAAVPGVGLFQDTIPVVVEWLVRTFLRADETRPVTSEGLNQSTQSAIDQAAQSEFEPQGYGVGGPEEPAQTDVPSEPEDDVRPIMGQFELPRTGLPLWNFVRLMFEDIDHRVYLNTSMFLNQMSSSLASLVDTVSNQLMNEVIYDFRRVSNDGLSDLTTRLATAIAGGGYSENTVQRLVQEAQETVPDLASLVGDVAPYMILRQRPLFANELMDLDGPTVDESQLVSMDLGESDADLHNMTMIDTPSIHNNSPARIVSGFPGFRRYRNETLESIRRHGLRYYQDSTMAWPGSVNGIEVSAPHPDPDLVAEWEERLSRAGLDNVHNWSGSVSIPKFLPGLFLGGKLVIMHRIAPGVASPESRVYYVDSIDRDYTASLGRMLTTIALTRGQPVFSQSENGIDESQSQAEAPYFAPRQPGDRGAGRLDL